MLGGLPLATGWQQTGAFPTRPFSLARCRIQEGKASDSDILRVFGTVPHEVVQSRKRIMSTAVLDAAAAHQDKYRGGRGRADGREATSTTHQTTPHLGLYLFAGATAKDGMSIILPRRVPGQGYGRSS
jgi:hypothetical protein